MQPGVRYLGLEILYALLQQNTRRRRVRRCPLEPASAVASCRPWRGLPLMPRRVPSRASRRCGGSSCDGENLSARDGCAHAHSKVRAMQQRHEHHWWTSWAHHWPRASEAAQLTG